MTQTAKIEIYTTGSCIFCARAKQFFHDKHLTFTEIRVDIDQEKQTEMFNRTNGQHSVPQIFINDVWIGGSDALLSLEKSGKLTTLLNSH